MDRHKEMISVLFEDVPDTVIDQLYDLGDVRYYRARDFVCRQGEVASTMYILLSGSVGIYADVNGRNIEIDTIRDGTFGELSFLLDNYSTRSAHVICHEDTTVLQIDGRRFRELSEAFPSLGFSVTRIVLRRLMSQYAQNLVEVEDREQDSGSVNLFPSGGTQDSWSMTSIINTLFDQAPERVMLQFYSKFSNFREPKTDPQYLSDVFVIMPFRSEFDSVYQRIKKVIVRLNLSITRGDFFSSGQLIMTDVWSALYNARFVLCDCTSQNANVFYELGIAHTIGKKVILLTQNEDDIPFDVKSYRYIKYSKDFMETGEFKAELEKAVRRMLND